MTDFSAILVFPTARPPQALEVLHTAAHTTDGRLKVALGIVGGLQGRTLPQLPRLEIQLFDVSSGPGQFIHDTNQLYRRAVTMFGPSRSSLIGFWADDFYPERDWLKPLCNYRDIHPQIGFFQPFDGIQDVDHPDGTVPFATHWWWEERNHGVIWPPIYKRFSCDVDNSRRAMAAGEYAYVRESRVIHRHWCRGSRPKDRVDEVGDEHYHRDRNLFDERLKTGLKVTW